MRTHIVLATALAALTLGVVRGQQAPAQAVPHAGYVFPAGGRQGSTFQVVVAGQFLDGVARAPISGGGVTARVVAHDKPLPQRRIAELRETLQGLQAKAADPAVRQQIAALREQIADSVRRNANPVLAETVTLDVTIAKDAAPSTRVLRLGTPQGLSNPLVFDVGQLPEFVEGDETIESADGALEIPLPATVNGRLIPGEDESAPAPARQPGQYRAGDVDRFRFRARKGDELMVVVSARSLMPYVADAVPGWLQAIVTLFDASGRELAYADDYRFDPDPVLHYTVVSDGDYVVEIRDALYRGREDFVYRISVGALPFIESIFPLGGAAGTLTRVTATGWNLDRTTLTIDVRKGVSGVRQVVGERRGLRSNSVAFAVDALADRLEREPNDSRAQAMPVAVPAVVNGRIDRPGDRDVYRFEGRAGDTIVAEVLARRLGSPIDSSLELMDPSGNRLAVNDDAEDRRSGLITHHADSYLMVALPATGTYTLRLGDVQRQGGPAFAYRLRLTPPEPDFDLRIAPSAINVARGGPVPITAYAIRRDGFAGDVALTIARAPAVYTLSGAVIPAGQDHVRLTLSAAGPSTPEPIEIAIEGRAVIRGHTVVRRAVPVDEMTQAFAYRHLVASDALWISAAGRGGGRGVFRVVESTPVRIPAGGQARVRILLPPAVSAFEKISFELSDPPAGLTLGEVSVQSGQAEFVLRADSAKAEPGNRGNLLVTVSGERVPAGAEPAAARRRVSIGWLPAIPFEISAR